MTIQEFYESVGGNYSEVVGRFQMDVLVMKFLHIFPKDNSMATLSAAVDAQDAVEAFHAAHTLKGVALNLGLGNLAAASSDLTEALRGAAAMPENAAAMYQAVQDAYEHVIELLPQLKG